NTSFVSTLERTSQLNQVFLSILSSFGNLKAVLWTVPQTPMLIC
ncbi:6818_t:CDS:1, partial [Ambispora leptoticha]